MDFKYGDILFGRIAGKRVHCGIQERQPAFCSFIPPFVGIVVPVEYNPFVLFDIPDDQVVQCRTEIVRRFQLIGKLAQAFRNNRIQYDIRIGNGCG